MRPSGLDTLMQRAFSATEQPQSSLIIGETARFYQKIAETPKSTPEFLGHVLSPNLIEKIHLLRSFIIPYKQEINHLLGITFTLVDKFREKKTVPEEGFVTLKNLLQTNENLSHEPAQGVVRKAKALVRWTLMTRSKFFSIAANRLETNLNAITVAEASSAGAQIERHSGDPNKSPTNFRALFTDSIQEIPAEMSNERVRDEALAFLKELEGPRSIGKRVMAIGLFALVGNCETEESLSACYGPVHPILGKRDRMANDTSLVGFSYEPAILAGVVAETVKNSSPANLSNTHPLRAINGNNLDNLLSRYRDAERFKQFTEILEQGELHNPESAKHLSRAILQIKQIIDKANYGGFLGRLMEYSTVGVAATNTPVSQVADGRGSAVIFPSALHENELLGASLPLRDLGESAPPIAYIQPEEKNLRRIVFKDEVSLPSFPRSPYPFRGGIEPGVNERGDLKVYDALIARVIAPTSVQQVDAALRLMQQAGNSVYEIPIDFIRTHLQRIRGLLVNNDDTPVKGDFDKQMRARLIRGNVEYTQAFAYRRMRAGMVWSDFQRNGMGRNLCDYAAERDLNAYAQLDAAEIGAEIARRTSGNAGEMLQQVFGDQLPNITGKGKGDKTGEARLYLERLTRKPGAEFERMMVISLLGLAGNVSTEQARTHYYHANTVNPNDSMSRIPDLEGIAINPTVLAGALIAHKKGETSYLPQAHPVMAIRQSHVQALKDRFGNTERFRQFSEHINANELQDGVGDDLAKAILQIKVLLDEGMDERAVMQRMTTQNSRAEG